MTKKYCTGCKIAYPPKELSCTACGSPLFNHPCFTVVLLYPDYATAQFGETWCRTVEALNCVEALRVAREVCSMERRSIHDEDDLIPVGVFRGDHQDLREQIDALQNKPAVNAIKPEVRKLKKIRKKAHSLIKAVMTGQPMPE